MDCRKGLVLITSWTILMTLAVTSVIGVPIMQNGMPSIDNQEHNLAFNGPFGKDILRPSQRLILIILTEKCRRMQEQGVNPLPSYCWMLESAFSQQAINSVYDQYTASVPSLERNNDFQMATQTDHQQLNRRSSFAHSNRRQHLAV